MLAEAAAQYSNPNVKARMSKPQCQMDIFHEFINKGLNHGVDFFELFFQTFGGYGVGGFDLLGKY